MRIRTCRRCGNFFSTPAKYAKYCEHCKKPMGNPSRRHLIIIRRKENE
jgi:hypothetical protein